MALNLQRNSRLFVSTVDADFSANDTWEIPMQEGFSFSQANETQDIEVNEAGVAPTRGGKTFNTSLSPADWSFASYVRPISGTPTHAYQEISTDAGAFTSNTIAIAAEGTYTIKIGLDGADPVEISVTLLDNTTVAGLLARLNTVLLATPSLNVSVNLSETGKLRFYKNELGTGSISVTSGSANDLIVQLPDTPKIEAAVAGGIPIIKAIRDRCFVCRIHFMARSY